MLLQGIVDVPIYGRIASMQLFRPPVRTLHFRLAEMEEFVSSYWSSGRMVVLELRLIKA